MITDKNYIRDAIKLELSTHKTICFITLSGRFDFNVVMNELCKLKNEGYEPAILYCNELEKEEF